MTVTLELNTLAKPVLFKVMLIPKFSPLSTVILLTGTTVMFGNTFKTVVPATNTSVGEVHAINPAVSFAQTLI